METNRRVVLVGFYNEKALGVRCLAAAAQAQGYEPHLIFFKGFNSAVPSLPTPQELALLQQTIDRIDPLLIGFSVMSSLYWEGILLANDAVRATAHAPICWGGVLPTLVPERYAPHCDFLLRGEGEEALVDVLDRLRTGQPVDGALRQNPVRPLQTQLHGYGIPAMGGENICMIERGRLTPGDPQLASFVYELSASRGCPFQCTYCSAVNLRRVYPGQKYVRFRSVDSVLEELRRAKQLMPRLRVIHFWDEIFSDEPGWVEEFSRRYPREIGLPFRIWGHPLKTEPRVIGHLVRAGLWQVVMGIQTGSARVRSQVFHRYESQDQILAASVVLSGCKVPRIVYDFMLCHPFETQEDLWQTYDLCTKLHPPFSLNIHGLNFLPATDIIPMALEQGFYTPEQLEAMMFSTIQDQYDRYWGPAAGAFADASAGNTLLPLIELTQYPALRQRLPQWAAGLQNPDTARLIAALARRMARRSQLRHRADQARLALGLIHPPK